MKEMKDKAAIYHRPLLSCKKNISQILFFACQEHPAEVATGCSGAILEPEAGGGHGLEYLLLGDGGRGVEVLDGGVDFVGGEPVSGVTGIGGRPEGGLQGGDVDAGVGDLLLFIISHD